MAGDKPPKAFIEIQNEKHEVKLGTYCWKKGCVDTVGSIELLEGKKPIKVKAGEAIKFVMDYEPKPNEFHVIKMNEKEANLSNGDAFYAFVIEIN
jgi:hypothetical protein